MARREPSITSEISIRGCCLCRAYSLKPASNILAMPCAFLRPAVRPSNSLFKSPPVQKAFSKSSALASARLIVANFIKIYHQENNEVMIKTSSTNCTGRLAPATSEKIDISLSTATAIIAPRFVLLDSRSFINEQYYSLMVVLIACLTAFGMPVGLKLTVSTQASLTVASSNTCSLRVIVCKNSRLP